MAMSVQTTKLDNGLAIITHHMPHLESVALGLWIRAGSRDERDDEAGIAHFLEHMAFKGTKRRSAWDIVTAIEDRGGDLNATTTTETTGYTAHVLKDDWATALDVIADIVTEPVFDPHEMERERGVILQEIAAAQDDPVDVVYEQADRLAFAGHPLGRPVLGEREVIIRARPADLDAFRARHYGAERMVLAAAGNIDHDALTAAAQRLLGHLGAVEPLRREKPVFRPGSAIVTRPQEQAHIVLAWPFPGYRDDAVWPAQVASAVLGGGMSSRLFQELRERRGLCYATHAQHMAFEDGGILYLYAATAPEQAEEARALMTEIALSLRDGPTEAELSRARALARAQSVMNLESATARASQLASHWFVWGRVRPMREILARIDAITAGEVAALARATFPQEPVVSMVLPGEEHEQPRERPFLLH